MIPARDSEYPDPDLSRRRVLRQRVLRWYARHRRVLPWRDVDNPYSIMVSEFMLQQTQVSRVLDHLPRWLERFPDLPALARASRRDVLLAWSGMGYNRRALQLHAAAQSIVAEFGGVLPSDPALLQQLPGFGRYTAHAVACFGHRRRLPLVEVNIRRVLSRLTTDMQSETRLLPEAETWRLAELLLPPRAFYDWNQALMDLGATICTARAPKCDRCPLQAECPSAHRLVPDTIRRSPAGVTAYNLVREVPRRIYRGRVVEFLRGAEGHCTSASRLHRVLFDIDGEEERARLLDILATLERDGMVRVTRRKKPVEVRNCVAPLAELRVCLTE
ncbi:MAG: A/G-specific adenine glycosylase [Bacteroidetes bacterium]|nr:A/G-specific adenine glycosylase [Bacteroidota bacterium]